MLAYGDGRRARSKVEFIHVVCFDATASEVVVFPEGVRGVRELEGVRADECVVWWEVRSESRGCTRGSQNGVN